MKDKIKPQAQKPSPHSSTTGAGAKRKAPSSLAVDTTTTSFTAINTPKKLRSSPLSATQAFATPTPTESVISPHLSTPSTPQTPSSAATSGLSARRQRTIYDPINASIYELRRQGLDWSVIADQTNAKEGIIGTNSEVSANGCYSRFFRNAPSIARERGEEFRKEWYLHMRGLVGGAVSEASGVVEAVEESKGEDEQDVGEETELDENIIEAEVLEAVEAMRADFWTTVAMKVNAKLGSEVVTAEDVKAIDDRARDAEI